MDAYRYVQLLRAKAGKANLATTDTYEAGFIFLVPRKGHPVCTLTNIKREPYIP